MLTPVPQLDGPRIYCGPTAISSVTGVHPHEVFYTINRLRGASHDARVIGMSDFDVCNTLGFLGYATRVFEVHPVCVGRKHVRVSTYFEERTDGEPVIVSTTNHYLVTDGTEALCNQTRGQPLALPLHPYALAYMRRIIHVRRRIK